MKLKDKDISIFWSDVYSTTLEDDEHGRWARVAYSGNPKSPFFRGKLRAFEIGWINKLKDPKTNEFLNKYVILLEYPYKSNKICFDTVEEAKKQIEESFRWFIKKSIQIEK